MMRVIVCGERESVVVMRTDELRKLTGIRISTGEYSPGFSREQILTMEFDMEDLFKSLDELCALVERRDNVVEALSRMVGNAKGCTWPVKKVYQIQATVVEKKGKKS